MPALKWKKGRGKLGPFTPLLGAWRAAADSPQGPVTVTRKLSSVLKGSHLQLEVHWQIGKVAYDELALIGVDRDGQVRAWSFTSDGKNSTGTLAAVSDLHPQAIGFEFNMPAGLARQAYWPAEDGGVIWVVEARTKKGWRRFTQHHYQATP
jgi:WD40 repeat protein